MVQNPLYRQVADKIREQIRSGGLKPGDALPTEVKLQQQFGVSRVTIRQAIKLLVEQDELYSVQGSGTYVREQRIKHDIYQLRGFSEEMSSTDRQASTEVLDFAVMLPPPMVASALGLTEQERVVYAKRLRLLDGKPLIVEETWLPLAMFPDLSFEVMRRSKYQYIEQEKGLKIDRSEQEIAPVLPSPDICRLLGCSASDPILEISSRGFLSTGEMFEFSVHHFLTREYKFSLVAKR
jgi:GntR family transcriptional regulator, mannosyl-D-glycerate transport/metabolism system repressor